MIRRHPGDWIEVRGVRLHDIEAGDLWVSARGKFSRDVIDDVEVRVTSSEREGVPESKAWVNPEDLPLSVKEREAVEEALWWEVGRA